jgi:DNA (cytosine-5)-methyltransferase 1
LALGKPQGEVAREARVEPTDLRKWERGLEMPPPVAVRRLAAALACSAQLLEREQRRFMHDATPGEGYRTAQPDESGTLPRQREPAAGRLRVLDLFCGSGGFSYGFELTGNFAVTAGLDLLPDRAETFRANHPSATTILDDIREVSTETLARHALDPDVVIGGPPCQGFSSIRPFRPLTQGDRRNNLFEHFALVVAALRPRWFVLENVVGLLTHAAGKAFPELLAAFKEAGYHTEHRVLNAAYYGLPQNRERLVVVGSREGRAFDWPQPTHHVNHRSMAGRRAPRVHVDPLFHQDVRPAVTLMEAIHDLPPVAAGEAANRYRDDVEPTEYERTMREACPEPTLHEATAHSPRMLQIIRRAGSNRWALPEGLTTSGFSSCYSRLSPDEPSVTLTVNFVHPASNKCIHPHQDRALTPREGARLQGFPDRFRFCGTRSQVVKQIGNAVPPLLGSVIARALAKQW